MPYTKKRKTFKKKSHHGSMVKKVKSIVRKQEEFKINTCYLKGGLQQLFPDRMVTKMRNILNFQFIGNAGAVNAFSILGSSLHTPVSGVVTGATNITWSLGTSIQGLPYLLSTDNATASQGVYGQYRIHGSAIKLKISNVSAANNDNTNIILYPCDSSTVVTQGNVNAQTYASRAEDPYCKTVQVSGLTTNKGVTLKHYMSTAKIFGLKYKSALESSQFATAIGSNPASNWAWVIYSFPTTTNSTALSVDVEVEYTIEFFDRNIFESGTG